MSKNMPRVPHNNFLFDDIKVGFKNVDEAESDAAL